MTSFSRTLTFVLLISLLLVCPVSKVHASSPSDSAPNLAAEAYLLDALQTSGYADLESFPEDQRNISGSAVVNALKDPRVQSQSFLFIGNVTVVDSVVANDVVLPGNLQFYKAIFKDYVDFNSSLLHAVWITESTFQNTLDFSFATLDGNIVMSANTFESLMFGRATINGSLDLRNNTFNLGIDFDSTHIADILLLDNSQILGTEPLETGSYPAEFWTASVGGRASFINTRFVGKADFAQAEFYRLDMRSTIFDGEALFVSTNVEHSADFTGTAFNQQVDFRDFTVTNTANFNDTSFGQPANFENFSANTATFKQATFKGDANFENATFTRDVSFADANFKGPAKFDYIMVGRFCDFIGTTFDDQFRFYYTSVAWPYFDGVTFNGSVNFEGMQASEDFEVTQTSYNYAEEAFAVPLVTVAGAVKLMDFKTPAGLSLSRSKFASLSIVAAEKLETAFIDISETDIENELTITNINMKSFTAEGATIGKSTNLSDVGITQKLDMRNASIGFLKIDKRPQWPTDPANFKLHGMTYSDIDIGEQGGLTKETLQALLELVNQSAYSPQAYEALSQFLTNKGHPDWAAEVQLNQKRRERREVLTPFSGAWVWSWFLDIFAGYGHRPVFAFIWSGLVIAIGALVFRRKENMIPCDQGDAKVEYNPIWYSFALFLPYIDLGIAHKWEPDPCRKWARNYKYVHMMLGWVLAPIALLTFSGII